MKIIDRLYQYFDFKGIKPTAFEKKIGLSNGYLGLQRKRNADIGESILIKIIDYCLDINPIWLITGNGEMLKQDIPVNSNTTECPNCQMKDKLINVQQKLISSLEDNLAHIRQKCGDCADASLKKQKKAG